MVKVTNLTSDIEGAQPKKRFAYREGKVLREEVEGTKPKPMYHKRFGNKPDSFYVDDIEGAKPKTNMFKTSRVVDPLDPKYPLPSFEKIVYEEPRFLRDSFNVSDIEGTKPKQSRTFKTRNSYDVSDIEGTSAKWKPHHVLVIEKIRANGKSKKPNQMDVTDILNVGFKSRRCVNPLNPVYNVHGAQVRDCPKSTAPKPLKKETQTPFFSLHTNDIAGAKGGSASVFQRLRLYERTQFRETNNLDGIDGARPNTLKRGLKSKRKTDPLKPKYTFLHGCDTPTPPPDHVDMMKHLDSFKHPVVVAAAEAQVQEGLNFNENQKRELEEQKQQQQQDESKNSTGRGSKNSRLGSGCQGETHTKAKTNLRVHTGEKSTPKFSSMPSQSEESSQEALYSTRSAPGSAPRTASSARSSGSLGSNRERRKRNATARPSSGRSARSSASASSSSSSSSFSCRTKRKSYFDERDVAQKGSSRPYSAFASSRSKPNIPPPKTSSRSTSYMPGSNSYIQKKVMEKQAEVNSVRDLPNF